jgi:hypothetical protein
MAVCFNPCPSDRTRHGVPLFISFYFIRVFSSLTMGRSKSGGLLKRAGPAKLIQIGVLRHNIIRTNRGLLPLGTPCYAREGGSSS